MNKFIQKWFDRLDLPKYKLEWHMQDMADELAELEEAKGVIHKWSECSDICFSYNRALWGGYAEIELPIGRVKYLIGLIYMFPKYNQRWKFFVELGKKMDKNANLREVRNPKRTHKLEKIAKKYNFDSQKFLEEADKILRRKFLLK